jgi:hypothetical protein
MTRLQICLTLIEGLYDPDIFSHPNTGSYNPNYIFLRPTRQFSMTRQTSFDCILKENGKNLNTLCDFTNEWGHIKC